MPSMIINEGVTYNGLTYNRTITLTSDNVAASEPSGGIGTALAGTLSTRTDDNTGTLTMGSGHGILTGDIIDLYWDGGSRYNVTVGTVSGTSVPIDLGAGDNLPAVDEAITAMVVESEAITVTGNDAVGALAYSDLVSTDEPGWVVYKTSGNVVIKAFELTGSIPSFSWDGADVATNPFAGTSIAKVTFSHGNSDDSRTMGAVLLYD